MGKHEDDSRKPTDQPVERPRPIPDRTRPDPPGKHEKPATK